MVEVESGKLQGDTLSVLSALASFASAMASIAVASASNLERLTASMADSVAGFPGLLPEVVKKVSSASIVARKCGSQFFSCCALSSGQRLGERAGLES